MYRTVFLLALMGLAAVRASTLPDPSLDAEWEDYKAKFNKIYPTSKEELERRLNFEKNYHLVEQHNKEYDQGMHTYTIGINSRSDKSREELVGDKSKCRMGVKTEPHPVGDCEWADFLDYEPLKYEVDYRPYCLAVQNQGNCGSCWAFSVNGAAECQYGIEKGNPTPLSEQELLDCIPQNSGCCRGDRIYALEYLMQTGVMSGEDYGPYIAGQRACQPKNPNGERHKIAHIIRITPKNESQMEYIVSSHGVLAAGFWIDEDESKLSQWKSGIYSSKSAACKAGDKTNHAIVIVGYGVTKQGQKFWWIRNSWGPDANDHGYFMFARGSNMCGIAKSPFGLTYDPAFCPKPRPNYMCYNGEVPVDGKCTE